jgi:membrane-associated protease RseP (regulator of RpoE activity)
VLVPPLCDQRGLACELTNGGYGASDQTPFYAGGVPVLHFFTGTHRDYHRPSDKASLINATGGAAVAALVGDVAIGVAAGPAPMVQLAPAPPSMGDLRAAGASLGTVPDYIGPPNGQTGVLLSGVRAGGPAEQAGIRRGDILVALDGHDIRNVEDFMYALAGATPGAHGHATVVRDGKRIDLPVVFGPPTRR